MPPVPVFSALADPTRCRIVEILHEGSQPVHALAASFSISRPAISRHLRVLREAGLVSEKKVGRENLYIVHLDCLDPARQWLAGFLAPSAELPAVETIADEAPVVAIQQAIADLPSMSEEVVSPAPKMIEARPRKMAAISQMGFDF